MNEQEFNSLPLAQRKAAQQRLIDAGLYSGSPDGKWGPGTANAFKAEEKRRVEDAERERKSGEERDFRNRQLKIEEQKAAAEAAERAAAAKKTEQETMAAEAKLARKAKYDELAATPEGIAAKYLGAPAALAGGTYAGLRMGLGVNKAADLAQEFINDKLKGVASDRISGLTTRKGALEGARLSGALPLSNPVARVAARMAPHVALGGLGIAKGIEALQNIKEDDPYYGEQAGRAIGLGYIGAGSGLLKRGVQYARSPGVSPDAQSLAVINSEGLRRSGATPSVVSQNAPEELQDSTPKQEPEGKRKHSERLISAARSGGATGIKSKSAAATWIAANLGDENRAAIAKELGVKPGPKFQQRVLTAVKNMAKKPGASALVPAIAAGTAFLASPERAEASRDGGDFTGRDEALTNAGIAGGLAYGTGKAIESLPRVAGRAAGAGLSALVPSMAADAYDPTQEELNRDRNIAARYLPSFLRAGGVEEAYQMAQVPERSPVNAGPRLANPANPDAAIDEALGIVRRANGGRVSGGFHFDTGGRTDNIPLDVVPGTYIIPADVVSALGQGNTMAGIKVLDNMFPPQAEVKQPKAAGGRADPNGGRVPIIVAGGEFKVDPYHVAALGEGDVQAGADMLDEWVQGVRQQHIDTLKSLPGPAESATEEGRNRAPFEQGGHARSVSEDEVQFGYNPIDELRQSINTSVFTPEQAAENRRRTLMEALSVIPGPGNVISAQDAYTGAGDAYNAFAEGDYKGGALAATLAGLSGAGALFGLPVGKYAKSAADTGADTLHIFAGPTAKTADHAALAKAQDMASSGASRNDIWRDTGWFQGVDGKWRFEIDDSGAQLTGLDKAGTSFTGMNHPELAAAYGETPGIYGRIDRTLPMEGAYMADPTGQGRAPYISAQGSDASSARSASMHELQHRTQDLEGFAPGASPTVGHAQEDVWKAAKSAYEDSRGGDDIDDILRELGVEVPVSQPKQFKPWDQLTKREQLQWFDRGRERLYYRNAGEVEARNVQTRLPMSAADRRAKAPWLTQDVPDDQQIVRYRP